MKLPPFQLHRPASVEEAASLLHRFGDAASFYAGGTELLLVMKMGLTDLSHLVDLKRIDGLRSVSVSNGTLRIGGAATHREIESNPLVMEYAPAMVSVASRIANARVRAVGTLGGNLAFADPASDPATLLTALGACVEVRGTGDSRRTLPLEDLWVGAYQTALDHDELIEAVTIPVLKPGTSVAHERMKFQERPAITVTVSVTAVNGSIVDARVVVGAVAPIPRRLVRAEYALVGLVAETTEAGVGLAGDAAADSVQLLDDSDDAGPYNRQLTRVLVARTATQAIESALLV